MIGHLHPSTVNSGQRIGVELKQVSGMRQLNVYASTSNALSFRTNPTLECFSFIVPTLKSCQSKDSSAWIMSTSVPIRNSVVQTSPSTWRLGCTIECDRTAEPDETSVAAWKDGEDWYILRLATSEQPLDATPANSHEVRLIHEGGTLSAVWAIGNNAICKVHPWSSDTTSESETIKFVQKWLPKYLYLK